MENFLIALALLIFSPIFLVAGNFAYKIATEHEITLSINKKKNEKTTTTKNQPRKSIPSDSAFRTTPISK